MTSSTDIHVYTVYVHVCRVLLNSIISFEGCFNCPLVCSPADLQVVVVAVGVNLVTSVNVEHRVQTLGGAGILFKLLHLAEKHTEAERRGWKREVKGRQASERESVTSFPHQRYIISQ